MATIDELTEAYITAGETLFKAEDDLEKEFQKAKTLLPERAAYRKAEEKLSTAVKANELKGGN